MARCHKRFGKRFGQPRQPPWRGSLLPLGCAAGAKPDDAVCLEECRGLLRRPAGASSLATGVSVEPNIQPNATHCGGLARESGGSACINIECATLFASKLAPTLGGGEHSICNSPDSLWELARDDASPPSVARELAPARLRSSRKTGRCGLPGGMRGPAAQASGSKLPRHRGLEPNAAHCATRW